MVNQYLQVAETWFPKLVTTLMLYLTLLKLAQPFTMTQKKVKAYLCADDKANVG